MMASLFSLRNGAVPPTLNYVDPDPRCDLNIIGDGPLEGATPTALVCNTTFAGQTTSVVICAAD